MIKIYDDKTEIKGSDIEIQIDYCILIGYLLKHNWKSKELKDLIDSIEKIQGGCDEK